MRIWRNVNQKRLGKVVGGAEFPSNSTSSGRNAGMSALTPIADINGYSSGCPLLTQSGHSRYRAFDSIFMGLCRPDRVIRWAG